MIHGVWINNHNTLDEWGLALLADLSISSPEPKLSYVTVPEADGDMDITGSLTGGVVRYAMRDISFSLYPVHDKIAGTIRPATEEHAAMIRQKLAEAVHGQTVKLWLPDDHQHYFRGRMAIGEKGGYNNTIIPVTMTAEPWRYKNLETKATISAAGKINLANETRRAVPIFTTTGSATVTFGNVTKAITAGTHTFDDIVLQPGMNILTFSNVTAAVNITYQEAVL